MLTKTKIFFYASYLKIFFSHKFQEIEGSAWHFPKMDIYKCPKMDFGFSNGVKIERFSGSLSRFLNILFIHFFQKVEQNP